MSIDEDNSRTLVAWRETAEQAQRNIEFYRGLLDECAHALGREAFIDDTGQEHDQPLRLKIPHLVRALVTITRQRDPEDREILLAAQQQLALYKLAEKNFPDMAILG